MAVYKRYLRRILKNEPRIINGVFTLQFINVFSYIFVAQFAKYSQIRPDKSATRGDMLIDF
jgi:hypothetical protein